ncbi:MAG: ABC transporter substrate-binding protein [Proteobacteria bacterium]|nr:ABC transporter substrate-binding protein [Pseudomonadota bacterium]
MKKLVATLLICGLTLTQTVKADDLTDVKQIVAKSIAIVIDLVKDKQIDKATRNQKIIETIEPFFDFEFMAKVCLGKKHWKAMTPAKRKLFVERFVMRLQDSYLEKLDLYTDEEVVVDEAKRVKKRIHVVTHLVSKTDKMEMIYKFRKARTGWLVYDIEILGVSIVQTYRSQFAGFLKQNSIDDLLEKLTKSGSFTVPTGN